MGKDVYVTVYVFRLITYMNRHVEIVRLKLVGHFSKALETVLPHRLLEAKRLPGLAALL